MQEAKREAKKAKQRERDRSRKAAASDKKASSDVAGVSAADAAEDEVARAAFEAAQISAKCASVVVGRSTNVCVFLGAICRKQARHVEGRTCRLPAASNWCLGLGGGVAACCIWAGHRVG